MTIRPDDEKAILAVVLVLHEPDRVALGVQDVLAVDTVLESRPANLHTSSVP